VSAAPLAAAKDFSMRETIRVGGGPPAALPRLDGLLFTLGTVLAIELLSQADLPVATPGALMLLPVMYASFTGSRRAGLASVALVLLYSLALFDHPQRPFHYTAAGLQTILTFALVALTAVLLVGTLKSRLARHEASFRLLFAHHPLPMWVYDRSSLAFLEVNQAAVACYGYSHDEFLRLSIIDIRPPADLPRLQENLAAQRPPRQESGPWKHRLRDGSLIDVRIISHTLTFAGREAVLVVAENITERLRVEAQLAQLNAELEQRVAERTAQLELANRELEAFSYSVSHDLRAPLRSILGFSKALMEDYGPALDGAGQQLLRRIQAAGQRMEQLIDGLLGLARLARGEPRREPVSLSELALAIGQELQQAHPERRVALTVQPHMLVESDPRLLQIALENLIGNAWKFTARRDCAQISFRAELRDGVPVYAVRDNGAGFDMAYADRLFGPFQRLHPEQEYPGTGIGLATVQRIVHRLGGRIWAEGAVDRGACFCFTLDERQGAP
jgi:PAS domain S-box-containing protein